MRKGAIHQRTNCRDSTKIKKHSKSSRADVDLIIGGKPEVCTSIATEAKHSNNIEIGYH